MGCLGFGFPAWLQSGEVRTSGAKPVAGRSRRKARLSRFSRRASSQFIPRKIRGSRSRFSRWAGRWFPNFRLAPFRRRRILRFATEFWAPCPRTGWLWKLRNIPER